MTSLPGERESRERGTAASKKILYPFFHMGELLIDFTACPSICSIFQSEPISNCHDDHRPKSTVEPSLSLKGRDTYMYLKSLVKKNCIDIIRHLPNLQNVLFWRATRCSFAKNCSKTPNNWKWRFSALPDHYGDFCI